MIYDDIVIGGGISGLGYAYFKAQEKYQVLVLEKDNKPGGLCHSVYLDQKKDFWLEMGAHTLYNSYAHVIDLIESLNLKEQLLKRTKLPFRIYDKGQIHTLFRYINPISFIYGVIKLPFQDKTDQSVESYYGKLFGEGNYKRVLKDCFNAVLSQDAAKFPAEFLFNKKKRNDAYPRSFTLFQGISSLFDTLVEKKDFAIKLNHTVKMIEKSADHWQVITNQGVFKSKHITIATDVLTASKLLSVVMPDISSLLGEVKLSTIDSVGVIFQRKDLVHFKVLAGLIAKDNASFYSMISRDVVEHADYRGFVFHFKANAFNNKDAYLDFICQLLKVNKQALINSFFKENKVPILTVTHKKRLDKLQQLLHGKELSLTGNYFRRLAIEDCLAHSAQLKLN
ncbi:MAG: amine oxidase [Gammaproteobacteria bacterium]|nr:MAG: amine oxidase [Gammaproteobacteria bacterium]UTW42280.1 FAD-dependent oxidoreductase [bacterium SCSIO 12844]